uniref:Uncharacterized protein n=1 Tax=Peronospora matthiolae TaxID=2874970 RepID=A0AAV1T6M3_9STRA
MDVEIVAASKVGRKLNDLRQMHKEAAISQIEGEASTIEADYVDVRHKCLRDLARCNVVTAQHVPLS